MAELFDLCVGAMYLMSDITGLTYKEINIWLFVIIHPAITLTLLTLLIFKRHENKLLDDQRRSTNSS